MGLWLITLPFLCLRKAYFLCCMCARVCMHARAFMVVTGMELLIGCLMVKKISAAGRYIDGTLFSIDGLGISNNQTDTQGKKSLNRKAFYLRLHHPAATNTGDETVYLIIVSEERNCESIASGQVIWNLSQMLMAVEN